MEEGAVFEDHRRDDLSIPYNFAPREITDLKRWMYWKYSETGTKIPLALGGYPGSSTDKDCWSAFSITRDTCKKYDGIAFVIDAPYTGIDLDNCFDEKQNMRSWALPIIAKLDQIAYAEVSPSGNGIKFIVRARKKITRCVKKFGTGDDKQQMEVYDHARFWTITGDVWAGNREICDGQAAVDWICDEYLSGGAEEKLGTVKHEAVTYRALTPESSSLIDRANGYVSECKPVAKGGLRNAAFSISGHLHAMTDGLNQRLTDQEVEYLLRDWNSKNPDKLRNEELAEAARNGRTNGTPRADKVPKEKIRLPEVRLPKIPLPCTAAAVTPRVAIKRSVTDDQSGQVSGHSVQIPEKPPEVAPDPDNFNVKTVKTVEAGIPATDQQPTGNLTSKPKKAGKSTKPVARGEFPIDVKALPGFLGDVCRYNLSTALYPLPELALAAALTLLSTLTGGKVVCRKLRTNLMIIGLAPSGGGKDHGRVINRDVLRGCGAGETVGSERIASHAGVLSAMAEQWNTMFQIDEVHGLVMAMQDKANHLAQIAYVLQSIYSSANHTWMSDAMADRSKVKTLAFPHLVLYGSSVPGMFWGALTKDNLTGGLIGRCLIFEAPNYVSYNTKASEDPIPESIMEHARWWRKFNFEPKGNLDKPDGSRPMKIERSPEAHARLQSHAIEIAERRKKEDLINASIWSRTAEKTDKLALLFACSRCTGIETPRIEMEDAEYAIALSNFITRKILINAELHVSESEFEKQSNRIRVLFLEDPNKEWPLGKIGTKTRNLKPKERGEILTGLMDEGFIAGEVRDTGGRPSPIYWLKKEQDEAESQAGN